MSLRSGYRWLQTGSVAHHTENSWKNKREKCQLSKKHHKILLTLLTISVMDWGSFGIAASLPPLQSAKHCPAVPNLSFCWKCHRTQNESACNMRCFCTDQYTNETVEPTLKDYDSCAEGSITLSFHGKLNCNRVTPKVLGPRCPPSRALVVTGNPVEVSKGKWDGWFRACKDNKVSFPHGLSISAKGWGAGTNASYFIGTITAADVSSSGWTTYTKWSSDSYDCSMWSYVYFSYLTTQYNIDHTIKACIYKVCSSSIDCNTKKSACNPNDCHSPVGKPTITLFPQ